ncbi:MAG: PaaI family thioesterase [Acidobacteriota bacterium]
MDDRAALLDRVRRRFDRAPLNSFLGMSLGYCENGVARVRLPYQREFDDRQGSVASGLIALLAETAGIFATASLSPSSAVKTVEFKINLLGGDPSDLLAIGEVVRRERSLATCRLEVIQGTDRVIAIGLATYSLLSP